MVNTKAIVFVKLLWVLLIAVLLFTCLSKCNTGCCKRIDTTVSVMTYNIQVDSIFTPSWNARKDYVVDNIRAYNPDVLGLQEAKKHQLCYLIEQLGCYEYVGRDRRGDETGEYNPILYRVGAIELLDSGTFQLPQVFIFPRICTWALFKDVRSCKQFYVFNTHFSLNKDVREKSVCTIVEYITDEHIPEPYVLCGDLNAKENSPTIKLLVDDFGLVDTWRLAHPTERPPPTLHCRSKIDFIFVSKQVGVVDAGVIVREFKKRPSDHNPVTAVLEF